MQTTNLFQKKFSFDPEHSAMIHDIKLDFYQKKIATCAADGRINIFSIQQNPPKLLLSHKAHQTAIFKVQWSPPFFGCRIASCSFDGQFKIFKFIGNQLIEQHCSGKHSSPLNSIQWAYSQKGIILAIGTAQGIQICHYNNGQWIQTKQILQRKGQYSWKVSWSLPDYNGDIKLVVGSHKSLIIYDFQYDKKINLKKINENKLTNNRILDVSWRKVWRQISQIVVLTQKQIIFYDQNLKQQQKINIQAKNLKIGWSQNSSILNIYSIKNNSFQVDSYECTITGNWLKIQKNS